MERGKLIITIDGPGASGKSSTARGVARALGIPYVSSGMLYRAAALAALKEGADPADEKAVMEAVGRHEIVLVPDTEGDRVFMDGEEVTERLHTAEVDRVVSPVAKHPRLRAWVNAKLKELPPPFVVDGRDMGRVVFPDAPFKFFLWADPRIRAQRRAAERGEDPERVEAELRARDARDQAQTQPAPGAVWIDTGDLTLEEVIARVVDEVRKGLGESPE